MELELNQVEARYGHLRIRPEAGLDRLVAALARDGQQQPVLVVTGPADATYVLIDGYRRVAALKRLGRDVVQATVLELTEAEALVWAWTVSRGGGRSALEEGWLLLELAEQHGLGRPELASRFARSESWVSRRLGLAGAVPERVAASVRGGAVSAHGAMRYLVPLARANASQCVDLVEKLGSEGASVRELGRLYAAWQAGDEEQRGRIVAHPRLYLKAEQELTQVESAETEEAWTGVAVRDLKMLGAVARRVLRLVDRRKRRGAPWAGQALLVDAWAEVRPSVESLGRLLRAREAGRRDDARPGDAHRDPAAGEGRAFDPGDREVGGGLACLGA